MQSFRKYLFVILICSLKFPLFSQVSYTLNNKINHFKHTVSEYPKGIYYSLDDFLNKKVSHVQGGIYIGKMETSKNIALEILENQVFFYTQFDSLKLKKVFAVSYNGNLYIQQRYFYAFAQKNDLGEVATNEKSFHRVIKSGNFLYLEGKFANSWKLALAYNLGPGGDVAATSLYKLKGIVFDFNTKRFDLFKSYEDLNIFLANYDLSIDLSNKYNIDKVREIIDIAISK